MHGSQTYPGELATVQQISVLAGEYRRAAYDLLARGQGRKASCSAPARLLAIQAIELQLNAFLLYTGHGAAQVRGLQHDLAARGELAAAAGLRLRKRTLGHLRQLSAGREYLTTRYGPELQSTWSQLNRLIATLDELTAKVAVAIDRAAVQARCPVAADAGGGNDRSLVALAATPSASTA